MVLVASLLHTNSTQLNSAPSSNEQPVASLFSRRATCESCLYLARSGVLNLNLLPPILTMHLEFFDSNQRLKLARCENEACSDSGNHADADDDDDYEALLDL